MSDSSFEFNVWKIRQEFPMLHQTMHGKPFIYFDSAATAHKPRCVIDEMMQFYREKYATVHRSLYDFASQATDQYNDVRKQVKDFLNVPFVEEIIFTRGTTEGINLVASCFGKAFIQKDDEIIISEMKSEIFVFGVVSIFEENCRENNSSLMK